LGQSLIAESHGLGVQAGQGGCHSAEQPSKKSGIDRFENIFTTVAKIIVVIFGNPIAMISALVRPAGFFWD